MRRLTPWLWPALWAVVIFATSSTYINSRQFVHGVATHAAGQISESAFNSFWHGWWWVFVKGYHVFEFALLFVLLFVALLRTKPWPVVRSAAVAALMSVLYAASDEYHQTFVKDRGGKVSDVLIDCIGIFASVFVVSAVTRFRRSGSGPSSS